MDMHADLSLLDEFVEMTEEEAKHFRPELAPNDDGRYSFECVI